jgi:hypothetical protein
MLTYAYRSTRRFRCRCWFSSSGSQRQDLCNSLNFSFWSPTIWARGSREKGVPVQHPFIRKGKSSPHAPVTSAFVSLSRTAMQGTPLELLVAKVNGYLTVQFIQFCGWHRYGNKRLGMGTGLVVNSVYSTC